MSDSRSSEFMAPTRGGASLGAPRCYLPDDELIALVKCFDDQPRILSAPATHISYTTQILINDCLSLDLNYIYGRHRIFARASTSAHTKWRDKWSDVRQLAYRQRTMHVSSLSGGALRKLKCFLMLLIVCTMTAVRCRPSGSDTSSNAEPLSVADGYIHFSVANDSRFREISRKAFESLISTDAKQELSSSHEIIFRRSDDITAEKLEKKNRKPERRKPLVDGRNHALITLNDPQTRSIQRCEGAKFKQRVKAPGCLTKVIINRFCHGTCSSYFIPRMSSKKLKAVFRSCAACAPKEYDRFDVTLDCPGQIHHRSPNLSLRLKSASA